MRFRLFVVLVVTMAAAAAEGIVVRHDRADADYRELAAGHPQVCRVGGGMGTLVAPQWVLTAAHVAESVLGGGEVAFGERTVAVSEAFLHPDYAVEGRHRDLGLVRLAEPVTDIAPLSLYGSDDELGRTVIFVGDGRTGTGLTGPRDGERIRRGANNLVSEVVPGWVRFVFDRPPDGLELEGISGPGDSGGPALVLVDDRWQVIGVSAFNDGGDLCTYGTTEHYARVSDERAWLEGVIAGKITASSERRLLRYSTTEDGQTTVNREEVDEAQASADLVAATQRVALALIAAINADDRDAFRAQCSAEYLAREDGPGLESLLDFLNGVREVRGDVVAMHPVSAQGLSIPDSDTPMLTVTWHLADGTSGYFGLILDDAGLVTHLSLFVRKDICRDGRLCAVAVPVD